MSEQDNSKVELTPEQKEANRKEAYERTEQIAETLKKANIFATVYHSADDPSQSYNNRVYISDTYVAYAQSENSNRFPKYTKENGEKVDIPLMNHDGKSNCKLYIDVWTAGKPAEENVKDYGVLANAKLVVAKKDNKDFFADYSKEERDKVERSVQAFFRKGMEDKGLLGEKGNERSRAREQAKQEYLDSITQEKEAEFRKERRELREKEAEARKEDGQAEEKVHTPKKKEAPVQVR